MNTGSLNERITRALAFMLRHQPEEFDLELDRFGWGDLEDVVYALQERTGSTVEEEDVAEAIEAATKKEVDRRDILVPEIHRTGTFKVQVKLHPEVTAEINLEVVSH